MIFVLFRKYGIGKEQNVLHIVEQMNELKYSPVCTAYHFQCVHYFVLISPE